jgi:site-specific DNA recombinase
MKAAIYARVSGDKQREEQTIESQRSELLEWATELGLAVPDEWQFLDNGYSGGALVRPALERLRDLVAEGVIEHVLIYSPDRLAREYAHQVLLLEEFRQAGADARFRRAPSGQTPEDQLVVQFQGMIAQYERAQILERTRRGKRHKALRGVSNVLSGAPYGFRYVPRTDTCDARYEVDPLEAEVARKIFAWFVDEQWSIGRIARELTKRRVATRRGKATWDRSTIWGMLRNPAYAGRAAFRKTQLVERRKATRRARTGQPYPRSAKSSPRDRPRDEWIEIAVPAIVDTSVFERAQDQLQRNKRLARHGAPVLLRGLLVCRRCSYALYTTSTRTSKQLLYYYRCLGTDRWRYPDGARCDNPPLRADQIDAMVWSQLTRLLENPDLIRREIERRVDELRSAREQSASSTQNLERELSKVERAIAKLLDAYQEELVDLDELRTRMRRLNAKRAELEHAVRQVEARMATSQDYLKLVDDIAGFTKKLRSTGANLNLEERQRVLRALVKEILVDDDRVIIRHSIPIKPTSAPPGLRSRRRSHHPSLRRSFVGVRELKPLDDSGVQPLSDQTQQHSVPYPSTKDLSEVDMGDAVEKLPDIDLDDPSPSHPPCRVLNRAQRLVWRATRSKAVREIVKLLLVDLADHHRHRALQDLVLEGRDGHLTRPHRRSLHRRNQSSSPIRSTRSSAAHCRSYDTCARLAAPASWCDSPTVARSCFRSIGRIGGRRRRSSRCAGRSSSSTRSRSENSARVSPILV